VADRHLRKAHLARKRRDLLLMLGIPIGVHEHDRDCRDAILSGGFERAQCAVEIERALHRAVGAHALVDLDHAPEQHVGLDDVAGENLRPRLVADLERVAETLRGEQERALALALQQRIGGDRGAHFHRADLTGRDRRAGRKAEQVADALHRRVAIGFRILGQQLVGDQRAVRPSRDHVREGAAAIDPEFPTRHARLPVRAASLAQPPMAEQAALR